MSKAQRYYVALAFLPIALAAAALIALFYYQKGEVQRRDSWQRPRAIFDALGIAPGMRVGEWGPADTYFLEKLVGRVGSQGKIYAIRPDIEFHKRIRDTLPEIEILEQAPSGLGAALFVCLKATEQDLDDFARDLQDCFKKLRPGGRLAIIGVGSTQAHGFITEDEAKQVATKLRFKILPTEQILRPQFLLVVEKPGF